MQKEVETYLKRHIEKELKLVCENIFEIVDQFVAQGSFRSCAWKTHSRKRKQKNHCWIVAKGGWDLLKTTHWKRIKSCLWKHLWNFWITTPSFVALGWFRSLAWKNHELENKRTKILSFSPPKMIDHWSRWFRLICKEY